MKHKKLKKLELKKHSIVNLTDLEASQIKGGCSIWNEITDWAFDDFMKDMQEWSVLCDITRSDDCVGGGSVKMGPYGCIISDVEVYSFP